MPALWTDPRIRTLFSLKVLENLEHTHVWSNAFNTNWEGEITGKGSTVRVYSFPRPTVGSYDVPAGDLNSVVISYQRLSPTHQDLTIDQDKDWAIAEDRVQAMLARPDLFQQLAQGASFEIADLADRHLATVLNGGAGTTNPISGTGTNSRPIVGHGALDDITAYVLMERLMELLKNNSVPQMNVHIFVPTWFMTMLRTDLRLTGFNTDNARQTMRGEVIVQLAGITIHETINALDGAGTAFSTVPDANSQNRIVVAWEGASTWARWPNNPGEAGGMTDTIPASQNVLSHDNLMRSRYLWGAEVFIAQGIIVQTVQRGSYEA